MKNDPVNSNNKNQTDPPLWSIGIAMLVILIAPIVLYSLAPTGPIREGDTVFADGQQLAQLNKPVLSRSSHTDETCLLDPNSPLIVLEHSTGEPFKAEVQGSPAVEWPFCPVHTEVLLKPHQIFQKPAALGMVRELLLGWFSR